MERLIDLAARQTGIDRIELRRRNLVPRSDDAVHQPVRHGLRQRRTITGSWSACSSSPTGQGFPARRAEARERGKCRGIGVANYVDTATGAPRERAEITVKPEGSGEIEVVVGTVSQGQGHETSFAQLSPNGSACRSTACGS